MLCTLNSETFAQKRRRVVKHFSVCGNPNVTCPTKATFEPYDLPFRMPANAVIYDTELFYAIILRSVSVPPDSCDNFIPEPERLAAQILFRDQKVFTSRCAEAGLKDKLHGRLRRRDAGRRQSHAKGCEGDRKVSRREHQTNARNHERHVEIFKGT